MQLDRQSDMEGAEETEGLHRTLTVGWHDTAKNTSDCFQKSYSDSLQTKDIEVSATTVRRRLCEVGLGTYCALKKSQLTPTTRRKRLLKVMFWGCISIKGTGRLHVVKCIRVMLNGEKYL